MAATREKLRGSLSPLVGPGTRVALLDFPLHSNVGDSAIWAGEISYLNAVGARVVHRSSWRTFDARTVRRALGRGGVVLLNGGGNLGDLYLRHHRLRLRVLERLGDLTIVQLPQTANFSPEALEVFGAAAQAAADFHVLVRDTQSSDLLTPHLRRAPVLAPDMAFAMHHLSRLAAPVQDLQVLLRTDGETAGARAEAVEMGLQPVDWLDHTWDGDARLSDRFTDVVGRAERRLPPPPAAAVQRVVGRAFDRRAAAEVRRGRAVLSRGRVVITDRLHAHLLSYLMGIPHVVLRDRHHKVSRASALWVGDHPWIRLVDDLPSALDEAQRLLVDFPLSTQQ